jgi:hypothetical protein
MCENFVKKKHFSTFFEWLQSIHTIRIPKGSVTAGKTLKKVIYVHKPPKIYGWNQNPCVHTEQQAHVTTRATLLNFHDLPQNLRKFCIKKSTTP